MFFRSKQKHIEAGMREYREKAAACVSAFALGMHDFCETGDFERLEEQARAVHAAESEADDLRRQIENMMYERALFPESRGDILDLLETMDSVVNQADRTLRSIFDQRITIPREVRQFILELTEINERCVGLMLQASLLLFDTYTSASALTGKMDELESRSDRLQAETVQWIFTHDLSDLQKILLRDLVGAIGEISDKCMNVGDRIRIIVVKRMI